MKYRNIKTGQVLETNCKLEGGYWEKLDNKTKKNVNKKEQDDNQVDEGDDE